MLDQVVEQTGTPSLDGAQDVQLAPVRGMDDRRRLPKELFERRPSRFTLNRASLGKPETRESFNSRFRHVDSWWGFVRAAYHLGRYVDVFRAIVFSVIGRPIPNVKKGRDQKRIRTEYWLFFVFLAGMVVFTAVTRNPFFLLAWAVPLLLISEPTH